MASIEGIGNAVTGTILAGAVEPAHGKLGSDGHTVESQCLNCGTPLVGSYCHGCGQHAHVHRTLTAFGHDFMSGVLNFEGKILRTVPLLAWRPGDLTRRYIDGQRARFVSPFALFLFAVFFFFAVFQSTGAQNGMANLTDGKKVYHSTDEALAGARAALVRLQAKRAKEDPDLHARTDERIAERKTEIDTLQRIKDQGIGNAVLAEASKDMTVNTDVPFLNEAITRVKANPQLALYKLQDATSKFAWALIPISVPFVWLLFPFRRRFRLYDHTVFVTYSLSFMLLLGALLSLWVESGVAGAGLALTLVPPLHMYRQLKGAYELGRWGALVRTILLLTFAGIALLLFALLVAVLGIAN